METNWREKLVTETRRLSKEELVQQINTKSYSKVKMIVDAYTAAHEAFTNVQLLHNPELRIDVKLEGKAIVIDPLNLTIKVEADNNQLFYRIEGSLFQTTTQYRGFSTVSELMKELISEVKHFVTFNE